jgi:hypothetical protein
MNPGCFKHSVALSMLLTISTVQAQSQQLSPFQLPNVESPGDDGGLQKIIDGEYAPEIYRVSAEDDVEKRLMKQQINCLYAECAVLLDRVEGGTLTIEHLLDARRRLGDARLEYHADPEEKRKIMDEQLANAKMLEESFAKRMSAGLVSPADAAKAAYHRINVELAILRLDSTANNNDRP